MEFDDVDLAVGFITHYLEIASLVGINFIMAAIISAVNRYRPLTRKLFVWGSMSLAAAAGLPQMMAECKKINGDAAIFIGLIICTLLTFAYLWALFLPLRVAKSRAHPHRKAITILNLLAFIPFIWLAALWWATRPQEKAATQAATNFSPQTLAIVARADAAAAMLEEAHLDKAGEKLRLAAVKNESGEKILTRLNQTLDKLMFDFELPEKCKDELRSLAAEIESVNN